MKVVGKRILVRQAKTKEVSKGGIVMAGEQTVLPYGTVLQVGLEAYHTLGIEKMGDVGKIIGKVVLFDGISAIPINLDPSSKESYVLIEPEDILAILDEGEY